MKKILFILAMVIGLSASLASSQERCDRRHGSRPGYEHRDRHHRSPYFVSENKVYFDGGKIEGAYSDSFNILSDWYAKDTWNVYFDGKKINGASPDSFKVLRDGYAKDTWNVYFDAVKIKEASPDSFKVFHDGYV